MDVGLKINFVPKMSHYMSIPFRVHLGKTSHYFSSEVLGGGRGGGGVRPRGMAYEVDPGKENYFISFPNFFEKKNLAQINVVFHTTVPCTTIYSEIIT